MAAWGQVGRVVLLAGIALVVVGGVLVAASELAESGRLPWLGRLPGDIHVERRGFSCYAPLATGLVLSVILTLVLNLLLRLFRR